MQERQKITRAVNHAQDFHAVEQGQVQDQNPFEPFHPKNPERFQIRLIETRMPSHVRLAGEKRKCFVGRNQKSMAKFR
jgi:hypothetical protein